MKEPKDVQTQAYVVDHKGAPFVLRDVILDKVLPTEVLVEMKYTGLCHTDIVVQNGGMPIGDYPVVLGHEGVGIVRWIGSAVADKALKLGDTVALSFHTCQQCRNCKAGQCGGCPHMTSVNFLNTARSAPPPASSESSSSPSPISLPNGSSVHGQFFGQSSLSKLAIVTEKCVVRLDGARPDELQYLAPMGCGYLTGAGTVMNVLKPQAEDSVVVLGLGAVGFAAILAAVALGVRRVVAVDLVDAKLNLAASLGATDTINTSGSSNKDLAVCIRSILPNGADKIVDATGVPHLLESAIQCLAHGGTLALVGVPPPEAVLKINALDLLLSCKRVIGVIEGLSEPCTFIPRLFQLFRDGRFPVDRLATVYPAAQLAQAIEDLKSGRVVKPILSWEDDVV
ncbi:chaperonin 10-like protein [Aspergillus pseudoustus]|uniref:Chaperonin 10-like protein n=1 Tax=Aspergillus pseudoustus TaxID=1810923 RepID=A0ABR4JBI7_9EURO